jgi:hypothetical protein
MGSGPASPLAAAPRSARKPNRVSDGIVACLTARARPSLRQEAQSRKRWDRGALAAARYRESAPTSSSASASRTNSMIAAPAARLAMHSGNLLMRSSFKAELDVLPHRSHITRGGGPSLSTIDAKSASFVMTTAPAARAAAKIGGSSASRNPSSRTEAHSTAKVSEIH